MISQNSFLTERLEVQHWRVLLDCLTGRQVLICELSTILTPQVFRDLPESLHLIKDVDAISLWIEDRAAECEVLTIRSRLDNELVGLLITAPFPEADGRVTFHLCYLIGEAYWGRGYASELVQGFVDWHRRLGTRGQLRGGVVPTNVASMRVMEKAGFERLPHLSCQATEMFGLRLC